MLPELAFATILITASVSVAFAQSTGQEQTDNPEMTRLVHCHGNYAVSHASSSATPTEISIAAMSSCQSELNAVGESTYQQALAKKLPLQYAEGARDQVVQRLKDYLPGFVIGLVIEERGKIEQGGG